MTTPRKKYTTLNPNLAKDFPELQSIIETHKPPGTIPPYTTGKVHKRCEHCDTIHPTTRKDIERGKGLYCSLSCAAYSKAKSKFTKTCKFCGIPFQTTQDLNPDQFCCLECESNYTKLQEDPTSISPYPKTITHPLLQNLEIVLPIQFIAEFHYLLLKENPTLKPFPHYQTLRLNCWQEARKHKTTYTKKPQTEYQKIPIIPPTYKFLKLNETPNPKFTFTVYK